MGLKWYTVRVSDHDTRFVGWHLGVEQDLGDL